LVAYNQTLQSYVPVSAQTIDYGTVQQVSLILSDVATGLNIQTTTFYNETTNTATVISVV